MAGRRKKLRRVGIIPKHSGVTPDGLASGDAIDMTIDEIEVLQLQRPSRAQGPRGLRLPLTARHRELGPDAERNPTVKANNKGHPVASG